MNKISRYFFAATAVFCSSIFAFAQVDKTDFKNGMDAYVSGDYRKADEFFGKVSKADADNYALSVFLRASIASASGRGKEAVKLYEQSFANPPKNNESALALSFAKYADANGLYAECAKLLPTLPDFQTKIMVSKDMIAWYYARALLEEKEQRRAYAVLGEMWDAFSEDRTADSCDLLAFALADKNPLYENFSLSESQLKSAESLAAKFRADMISRRALPVINAQNVSALSLGQLYYLASDFKNKFALGIIAGRARADSSSVFAWRAMYAAAQNLFSEKDYKGAMELLDEGESFAPDDLGLTYPITILKGDCYRMLKDYPQARREYLKVVMSKLVKGQPSAEAVYKTGMTWYSEGEFVKAHMYFERTYVAFFPFEYWASRAYLYDAKSLQYIAKPNMAFKVLREYLKTAKIREGAIYEEALKMYTAKE